MGAVSKFPIFRETIASTSSSVGKWGTGAGGATRLMLSSGALFKVDKSGPAGIAIFLSCLNVSVCFCTLRTTTFLVSSLMREFTILAIWLFDWTRDILMASVSSLTTW